MGANSSCPDNFLQANLPKSSTFSKLSQACAVSDTDICGKDKKKKASKFATLRKKLTRVRRHSRSFDYGRTLREVVSSWSMQDTSTLVHEYESIVALKELAIAANLARPAANPVRQDLATLFDYKFCTDIDLIYRGACFPAHRALLSARSPFFQALLGRYPDFGSQIPVKLKTPGVDVAMFVALMQYLYTDIINTNELRLENQEILVKLAEELGMPSPLEDNLRTLLETGQCSDAVLVFMSEDCQDSVSSDTASSRSSRSSKHELRCHKAILAARSPFFRNLLIRRARSGEELTEQTLQAPSRIVLDESVIPRRYARVLLNAIYQDTVDLSLIIRNSSSMCSLSEVQAIVAGKGHITLVDEAMEIYQIGQFLDFSILSQGCEDIIVDSLSVENLVSVLTWSSEPHGSCWVHRQALHFLREEFLQLSHSSVLFELSRDHLIEALSSDFLQAGELDILTAVLKWGEYQLIRRIEEREPNLLSHTAHSVSRKGVKKRDLDDIELRDILADLLPMIRMDHVIPHNSDVLSGAIKRGLVSTPPSHMISDEKNNQYALAWVRGKNSAYLRPRLFTPYYEEAKAVLEEQLSQGSEQESVQVRTIQMSAIPDTLYMVEDQQYMQLYLRYTPSSPATMDIIAGTIPVPDMSTLNLMLQREQELQSSRQVQRAYQICCHNKRSVISHIQLRVVREFGLPDSSIEVLQNSQFYCPPEDLTHHVQRHYHASPPTHKNSPPLGSRHKHGSPAKPVQCVSPTRSYASYHAENDISPCSDVMPDIAMATSSVGQLHLHDQDVELPDIGDGSNHGPLYI